MRRLTEGALRCLVVSPSRQPVIPRNAARAGPPAREPTRHVQHPTRSTDPRSPVTVARPVDELAARRELRSWIAAAEWLNGQGYAAAVPAPLVAPLAARGLAVWGISDRRAA